MSSLVISSLRAATLAAVVFGCAALSRAQIAFNVTVDTSKLSGSMASPLYLDFQLNDGAGWGDANNTAVVSNFKFGGGTAFAPATTFGGAMGNFGSWVSLTDSAAFNEFYQGFAPGAWLSFTVSLSNQMDWGVTPDLFGFAILDSSLRNKATTAVGTDLFLQVNIDGPQPAVWTFGSLDGMVPAPQVVPVPEPSTYGLLGGVGLLLVCFYRRRVSRR